MKNFFKYLTSSESDKQWGLYLTVSGRYHSLPGAEYPSKAHPTGYYFDWNNGRALDEYQLNYITEGFGYLETSQGLFKIKPGMVMIIHPGVKHRYRPDKKTGWVENYIGFKGNLAPHFLNLAFRDIPSPVLSCGNRVEIIDVYQKIFDLTQIQKPAYQQVASGMILKLVGLLLSIQKQSGIEGKDIEDLITTARAYMWENVDKTADLQAFAKSKNFSYSSFRKLFKQYTGIAPYQYFLDLKIVRAKELIASTDKSVKEMAYELGFDSIHYFSRLFKKKTGVSPSEFRRRFL
uniref:AraC family transcriptional regulator n=1 Tax=Roseihalotalea indica TaxID=2867963 RepID=A0AA49GJH9_9BACT|nr:AraC family transcriptional regulator [Tunicatimonas sp. TK19036]